MRASVLSTLLCALLAAARPTRLTSHSECPTLADLAIDRCTVSAASTGTSEVELTPPWPPTDLTVYDSLLQMGRKAKTTIVVLSSLIAYVSINSLAHALNPSAFVWSAEDREEQSWIATSRSWLDRKACRWLGVCGAAHLELAGAPFGHRADRGKSNSTESKAPWRSFWSSGRNQSQEWDADERARRQIPDYIFDYAPLVHLYSGEQFWPGDIAEHLYHTTPMLNYTLTQPQWDHSTLRNLDQLNQWEDGKHVFLTSNDDVQTRPPWLEGEKNIPQIEDGDIEASWADWDGGVDDEAPSDTAEDHDNWSDPLGEASSHELHSQQPLLDPEALKAELRRRYGGNPIHAQAVGRGRSEAPAILLVMDKGHGVLDAFWFYFYSFNLGNTVVNIRFGNHVGDWEHCLVRFHHGKPKELFLSAHSAGEAYSYEAVEKIGKRPVIYSAEGSHAMYATPGIHEYLLPWGLLHDVTDRGPLWDPLFNSQAYTYDFASDGLRASTFSPAAPTEWFYFNGHWGDKFYPLSDYRQYRFAGQYHYVNGPIGPRFKHLDRQRVCQGPDRSPCVIKNYIEKGRRARRWEAVGPGE